MESHDVPQESVLHTPTDEPFVSAVQVVQRAELGFKADVLKQLVRMYNELRASYNSALVHSNTEKQDTLHYKTAQEIYTLANGEMGQGRSLRQLLDFPERINITGMLPVADLTLYRRTDILTTGDSAKGSGLSALCDLIVALGGTELGAGDTSENIQAAVIVSSLVGISAARMDSNWRLMGDIHSWCNHRFPDGATSRQYVWLEVANLYYRLGNRRVADRDLTNTQDQYADDVPEMGELNELLEKFKNADCDPVLKDSHFPYFAFFLLEAVAQLPHVSLNTPRVATWIESLIRRLDNENHGYENEQTNRRLSRFRYVLSRIFLAQEDIGQAMSCATYALQFAPEWDLRFMELCRQQILALEQEIASSHELRADLKAEFEAQLSSAKTQFGSLVESQKEELKDVQGALSAEVLKSAQESRNEIRDSLMRVIEILGVFIGIAGVAVTSVAGIVGGRTIGESVIIYALGYFTIVSLLVLLRIILGSSQTSNSEPHGVLRRLRPLRGRSHDSTATSGEVSR